MDEVKTGARLAKLRHRPWPVLGATLLVVLAVVLFFGIADDDLRNVSAAEYADLHFNGIVSSNNTRFGSFTITNRYEHPLNFAVNNIEVRSLNNSWNNYAMWLPGSPAIHPKLGNRDNHVAPGAEQTILVPCPDWGVAWKINVGVLKGIKSRTIRGRLDVLLITKSLTAALASSTNYSDFTFAGMLKGPEIPTDEQTEASP